MTKEETKHARSRFNADTVTAIAASVIALVSLFVSLFQMSESRRYDRISVRPSVRFTSYRSGIAESNGAVGFFIANKGLGPAIVRDLEIVVDGKAYSVSDVPSIHAAFVAAGISNLGVQAVGWRSGSSLRAGEESPVIYVKDATMSSDALDKVFLGLSHMELRVEYESMYGESFKDSATWPFPVRTMVAGDVPVVRKGIGPPTVVAVRSHR